MARVTDAATGAGIAQHQVRFSGFGFRLCRAARLVGLALQKGR